jgi:phosphate transport system permease protein
MSSGRSLYDATLSRRHRLGVLFHGACAAITWSTIGFLLILLGTIVYQAWGWLTWSFLTSYDSSMPRKAGIFPGLWGTIWLIGMTGVFCVPLGVGAAVYLEEYARRNWITRFIQLNISNLAGVPSIVYGMLGYTVFVRMFDIERQSFAVSLGFTSFEFNLPFGRTVIAGALTLTLLSLPVVIIASQEALRAVPSSIRHAAYALGATKWQTIWHQVLPASMPGILTGVILALSRALGETAPLAVLGVATYITFTPGRIRSVGDVVTDPGKLLQAPFDQFSAIPLQIYNWVFEQHRDFQYHVAAAGILVLLGLLILTNGTAIYLRHRFAGKIRW